MIVTLARLVLLLLLVVPVIAQEKVSLTTPVFVDAGATDFRVWALHLRRDHPDAPAEVRAIYRQVSGTGFLANGKTLTCLYAGPAADTLILALNKANLSTISLEKRVMTQCQTDKQIGAGTISGVVQE